MSCVFSDCVQDRPGTNAPLNFTVVGGWSVGYPSLISEVARDSVPEKAGLRVGDMVSS